MTWVHRRINHRRCNYGQIGSKSTSNSLKRRVAKKEKISCFGCYKLFPFWIVHFTPESLYTLAGIISSLIKTIAFSAEPASQKFVFGIAEEAGNRISDIYYGSVLQVVQVLHDLHDFFFLPSARCPSLLNFIHHHEMSLVPVHYGWKWHLIAELFPGKPVATGAESDAFGSIAYAKHWNTFAGYECSWPQWL